MKPIAAISFGVICLIVLIGFLWLANAPMMPAQQHIEQVLPDDHIPR